MKAFTALLTVLAVLLFAEAKKYNTTSSRLKGAINLHLVPHTHDDTAWLKTTTEYSVGLNNSIQRAIVDTILDSVVKELSWNPDRKFIYVEQAFFQSWWGRTDAKTQAVTRELVANGQLEFINGGWCMHDEANPTYVDMIDQTTIGHRFLLQEFNVTPKTAWQIDPFGHSTFQASMMSGPISGYNAVFFERADYQEIEQRNLNTTTEMIWAPSESLGLKGATYAGILYASYCTISGLNMGIGSDDAPIQDNAFLPNYNVPNVINIVVQVLNDMVTKIPQGGEASDGTYDFMLLLGCDFNYENAALWYANTDRLIHWLNLDGRVNAFYSTPSIYAASKLESGKSYTLKSDDFFPYADDPHAYWTGYFTSRQSLKGYIRDSSALFQAAKQIQLLTGGAPDMSESNPLLYMEQVMGLMQHHDTVAGTSKQHVTYDDARMLAIARADVDTFLSSAFQQLVQTDATFYSCDLWNATICPALDVEVGRSSIVLVYNSLAQGPAMFSLRIPVPFSPTVQSYNIYDSSANIVTAQVIPLSTSDNTLRNTYYNYTAPPNVTTQWIAFVAELPAVGYSAFYFEPTTSVAAAPLTTHSVRRSARKTHSGLRKLNNKVTFNGKGNVKASNQISNGVITLSFDGPGNALSWYDAPTLNISGPFSQVLQWYNGSIGNDESPQASGAYIFRPNSSTYFNMSGADSPAPLSVSFLEGPVLSEAYIVFSDWAITVVRLWADLEEVEFEYTIGPIPYDDALGKEVVTRYITDFETEATWYTDSNARDSNKRVRNYRPSFNLSVNEPVAGNYYPVNGFMYMNDAASGQQFNVIVDRSQSGSSIQDGELEIMIQRRLQVDDGRGVGEPLNETGLDLNGEGIMVRSKHKVFFSADAATASVRRRYLLSKTINSPVLRFATADEPTPQAWFSGRNGNFSGISQSFPLNAHLLTAVSWGPTQLLVRISHNFESNDDPTYAQNVTIEIGNIFPSITINSCVETTLSANQPLADAPKITYNITNGSSVTLPIVPPAPAGPAYAVTVNPMEIRTFLCETAPQNNQFRSMYAQPRTPLPITTELVELVIPAVPK